MLSGCGIIANQNQTIPSSLAVFTTLYNELHQKTKAGTVKVALAHYNSIMHPR